MKTRQGFVSNSSSSSFIIKAGGFYKTTFDLALHMMKKRDDDWNENGDVAEAEAIRKTFLSRDTPIAFRTCNYDTRIYRSGDRFLVGSCHNHDFELQDCLPLKLTEEEMKLLGISCNEPGEIYDELEMRLPYVVKFWWPEFNVFIQMFENLRSKGPKHGFCKKCQNKLAETTVPGATIDLVECIRCRYNIWDC